jgi:hypothetical protein
LARTTSTARRNKTRVVAITATRGGPSAFAIDSGNRIERVVSSSVLILETLLPALLSGASPVNVELVLDTIVINRVTPFALGNGPEVPLEGEYTVSRIATQRKPDGTDEHLEAFLKKNDPEEKAYNVYDPFLQHILIAAFGIGRNGTIVPRVDVKFDGDEIVTVTLGGRGS